MTVYEQFIAKVNELTEKLSEEQTKLTRLQNNARYLAVKEQLAKGGNTAEWIASAKIEIDTQKGLIDAQDLIVKDLKNQLRDANEQLTRYENSSPTVKAEIESKRAMSALVTVVVIILGIATVIGIIVFAVRRNKKTQTN